MLKIIRSFDQEFYEDEDERMAQEELERKFSEVSNLVERENLENEELSKLKQ